MENSDRFCEVPGLWTGFGMAHSLRAAVGAIAHVGQLILQLISVISVSQVSLFDGMEYVLKISIPTWKDYPR